MSSLFAINEAIENCFYVEETGDVVDATTGEVLDENYLESLFESRNEKIKNIVLYIKNLEAEADAVQKQKMAFEARNKALKNRVESLKRYLTANLEQGEKISEPEFAIGWRKSEVVEVVDIKALQTDEYEHFLKYKEPEANKAAIKKALKAGEIIPSCHLVEKNNLQIK